MIYRQLGKIRDAHGIRGEVFLISFSKSFDWMENLKQARLVKKEKDNEGEWQEVVHTFSIKKKKPHKVGYILKLEGLQNRNDAEALKGAVLEIKEEDLKKEEGHYLFELKGFAASQDDNEIGVVSGFSSNGAQDLLIICTSDGKQIEVPNTKPLVEKVDFDKKQIELNLPEGFFDL